MSLVIVSRMVGNLHMQLPKQISDRVVILALPADFVQIIDARTNRMFFTKVVEGKLPEAFIAHLCAVL